jgi:hypothetical protein
MEVQRLLYDPIEAAAIVGISVEQLNEHVACGDIGYADIGRGRARNRMIRFFVEDLIALAEEIAHASTKLDQAKNCGIEDLPSWLIQIACTARKRAAKKGIRYTLEEADLALLLNRSRGLCEVSGIAFVVDEKPNGRRRPFFPSLDRIDNSDGYTFRNTRLVCSIVNIAMNEWGEEPLRKLAAAMARPRRGGG